MFFQHSFQRYFSYIATLFQLYRSGQHTYPCCPGVSLKLLHTIFFPSHWLLSHMTVVNTMVSGDRGMYSVAMTIINPRKEIGQVRD